MAEHDERRALPAPRLSPAPHVLMVVAPYYARIAAGLVAGARAALEEAGARHDVVEVPGALEIPPAIALAARARRFDGFVALGCVVRGETTHYETVCNDSSRGLALLGLQGLCIGNGVLTVENMDQARARADPAGMNKGAGAALAALHLIALARRFSPPRERRAPEGEILLAGGGAGEGTART